MKNSPKTALNTGFHDLEAFSARLLAHRARRLPGRHWVVRCGVVLLIAERGPGAVEAPALLMMRRAERAGDPWSGQVSFPGGRVQPDDADTRAAAFLRHLEGPQALRLGAGADLAHQVFADVFVFIQRGRIFLQRHHVGVDKGADAATVILDFGGQREIHGQGVPVRVVRKSG